ncbi:MAG TPA: hypothetical protein VL285_23895 [Bryobacteraceae bacterium]|nr:hypothetical protein [Bryobacteraceae bacterium]
MAALAALAANAADPTPEQRAVAYLAVEVPRWPAENGCFSCHNNGDSARALYTASRLGYAVPKLALEGTTRWLSRPAEWDSNRGNPGFSDKKLARIQFAAALAEAPDSGGPPLLEAAESLIPYQAPDGSWIVDGGALGSPATYGTALATYLARRTLQKAGAGRFGDAIAKSDQWFLTLAPASLLEAGAALLALPRSEAVQKRSLAYILPAQSADGGWGPYRSSPSEPFDTAVAVLALRAIGEPERTRQPIARGRAFLIGRQQPGGGWPETTRPPGAQSYAQHISTSGWATLALLLTR